MNPVVSIITVTYNNEDEIRSYIDTLTKITVPYEVIIVDNNSSDKTVEIIEKTNKKNLSLYPQSSNLGFSKANNIGVKYAKGDILFFLNPDTQILEDIARAIVYLRSHSDVGVIGPKLTNKEGQIQKSVRRLPTISGAIADFWFHQKNAYQEYSPNSETPLSVESVVGGAMLIPKKVFTEIGGWDERYFLYFEDLQLSKDIISKGYKIIYFPELKVQHAVGRSARTNPKANQHLYTSSKIYHGVFKSYVLYLVIRLSQVLSL